MTRAWISQQPQRGTCTLQYWRGPLCPCAQPSGLCCLHLPLHPALPPLALAVVNCAPCLVGALSAHLYLPCIKVPLIGWTSDTRCFQGCTDLQTLVKCLDHRGTVLDTVCRQAKVVLGCEASKLLCCCLQPGCRLLHLFAACMESCYARSTVCSTHFRAFWRVDALLFLKGRLSNTCQHCFQLTQHNWPAHICS